MMIWGITLLMSSVVVYALMSSTARLTQVDDLVGWFEMNMVFRYALSLMVALIFHSLLVQLRVQQGPRELIQRKDFRRDLILGYRIGFLWLLCLLIFMAWGAREMSLNVDWYRRGILHLLAMLAIASVEHWIFRGFLMSAYRAHFSLITTILILAAAWTLQRVVFFGAGSWLYVVGLFLEGSCALGMVPILGVGGSWAFQVMWLVSLHGFLGLPFMFHQNAGIFFTEYQTPQGLDQWLTSQGFTVSPGHDAFVTQSVLPLASLLTVLIVGALILPWLRARLFPQTT